MVVELLLLLTFLSSLVVVADFVEAADAFVDLFVAAAAFFFGSVVAPSSCCGPLSSSLPCPPCLPLRTREPPAPAEDALDGLEGLAVDARRAAAVNGGNVLRDAVAFVVLELEPYSETRRRTRA